MLNYIPYKNIKQFEVHNYVTRDEITYDLNYGERSLSLRTFYNKFINSLGDIHKKRRSPQGSLRKEPVSSA